MDIARHEHQGGDWAGSQQSQVLAWTQPCACGQASCSTLKFTGFDKGISIVTESDFVVSIRRLT